MTTDEQYESLATRRRIRRKAARIGHAQARQDSNDEFFDGFVSGELVQTMEDLRKATCERRKLARKAVKQCRRVRIAQHDEFFDGTPRGYFFGKHDRRDFLYLRANLEREVRKRARGAMTLVGKTQEIHNELFEAEILSLVGAGYYAIKKMLLKLTETPHDVMQKGTVMPVFPMGYRMQDVMPKWVSPILLTETLLAKLARAAASEMNRQRRLLYPLGGYGECGLFARREKKQPTFEQKEYFGKTALQWEVAGMLEEGLGTSEIASRLGCGIRNAQKHVRNVEAITAKASEPYRHSPKTPNKTG